jgi:hypothetical protein
MPTVTLRRDVRIEHGGRVRAAKMARQVLSDLAPIDVKRGDELDIARRVLTYMGAAKTGRVRASRPVEIQPLQERARAVAYADHRDVDAVHDPKSILLAVRRSSSQ